MGERDNRAFPEIASVLVSIIGKKLTAYIGNAKDIRTVDRWIASDVLSAETEQRLRFAYQVVMTLHGHDSPEVVQAWLTGVNPELGDRNAIRMLKEESLDSVGPLLLREARAFAEAG
jgi:hypothetical protein